MFLNNKILIFSLSVVIISIIDSSIVRLMALNFVNIQVNFLISFFLLIIITISITIYLFTTIVKTSIYDFQIEIKKELFFIDIIFYLQMITIVFLIIIFIDVFVYHTYKILILCLIIIIIHFEGIFFMCLLSYKFIKWIFYNTDKIIILYAISFIFFSLFIIFSLINYIPLLNNLLQESKFVDYGILIYESNLSNTWTNNAYFILSVLSFLSIWLTTSLLLNGYLVHSNKFYFWSIMSLPLIYYLSQFVFIDSDFLSNFLLINPNNNIIIYETFFIFTYPLAGIFLGITILYISKKIKNAKIKHSLKLMSIGFIFLFCSFEQSSLAYLPVPPFGISFSLMGIASFLIIVNLYYVIYLITKDRTIRREVMKIMGKKNFLINLSEAKKTTEIIQVVNEINNKLYNEKFSKMEPSYKELSKEEISDYLEYVRRELDKSE